MPCAAQQQAASEASVAHAEAQIQEALYQEIYGRNDQRQAMLAEALATQSDSDAARWQLGQVRVGDDWRTLDDVALEAQSDPLLAEYAERRAACEDTAAGHEQLARWCRRQGLEERERLEWMQVWRHDPGNEAAIARLGLVPFEGQLVTREARDEYLARQEGFQRAARQWRPLLEDLRRSILSGAPEEREQALQELRDIDDIWAVPTLESVFSTEGGELALLAVEVVGNIQHPWASESLTRHAVIVEDEAVRSAAIEQLQTRSLYEYVPKLLDSLQATVEAEFTVQVDGTGSVNLRRWVHREGREASMTQVYDQSLFQFNHVASAKRVVTRLPSGREVEHYENNMSRRRAVQQQINAQATVAAAAQQQVVAAAEVEVAALNEEIELRNARIMAVLEATTGIADFAEPLDWWQWWDEYNLLEPEVRENIEQYGWQHRYVDYAPSTAEYQVMPAERASEEQQPKRDVSYEDYIAALPDWSVAYNPELGKHQPVVDGEFYSGTPEERYIVGVWRSSVADVGFDNIAPSEVAVLHRHGISYRYFTNSAWYLGVLRHPQFVNSTNGLRQNAYVYDSQAEGWPMYSVYADGLLRGNYSCFVAGTPVWTEAGLRSIEEIRPGDRVLAQDLETGELEFRLVLERTERSATDVSAVVTQGETFVASGGHPFWVNGAGWRMVSELHSGDVLHGIEGAHFVSEVVPQEEPQPVYNLVVDEHHNYFIGESRILVHDVTLREPTRAVVPGLVAE